MTTFTTEKKKPNEFICYRRNVLMEHGINSPQDKIEAETIVEAAMVYFRKHGYFPDEIYRQEPKESSWQRVEAIRRQLQMVESQRDRFANAVGQVELEREAAVQKVDVLYNAIRQAITDVNIKVRQ